MPGHIHWWKGKAAGYSSARTHSSVGWKAVQGTQLWELCATVQPNTGFISFSRTFSKVRSRGKDGRLQDSLRQLRPTLLQVLRGHCKYKRVALSVLTQGINTTVDTPLKEIMNMQRVKVF